MTAARNIDAAVRLSLHINQGLFGFYVEPLIGGSSAFWTNADPRPQSVAKEANIRVTES